MIRRRCRRQKVVPDRNVVGFDVLMQRGIAGRLTIVGFMPAASVEP
jgi:hypothetical protein